MQVIEMHLASESTWSNDKEVFYLAVGGDSFVPAQHVDLKFVKEVNTIPFYVFEHPPTEDGFLGVDKKNNTFVFAAKQTGGEYRYFVTDLGTMRGKCSYNPYATVNVFLSHFKQCVSNGYAWRRPFLAFEHDDWVGGTGVTIPSAAPPPPPKPKYKWTLTSQGVAFQ
jgi:hypothetical protein